MSSSWSGPVAGNEAGRIDLRDASAAATQRPGINSVWAFVSGAGRVEALERYGMLVARLLMSQIFLLSGIMKIVDWSGTEAQMAGRGMFWVPFFHVAAMLVELGAGLSLLLGFKARLRGLGLFPFLIPVTLPFPHSGAHPDPKDQHVNM